MAAFPILLSLPSSTTTATATTSTSTSTSTTTTSLLGPIRSFLSPPTSSSYHHVLSRPPHAVAFAPSFSLTRTTLLVRSRQLRRQPSHIVRMAPEEEKMTRRSPLDFPIEWERPKPGRRPDIFPKFSPMKTPLPPPLPADPPEEDEEEEEKKEEEDEDPDKEDPDRPDQ